MIAVGLIALVGLGGFLCLFFRCRRAASIARKEDDKEEESHQVNADGNALKVRPGTTVIVAEAV